LVGGTGRAFLAADSTSEALDADPGGERLAGDPHGADLIADLDGEKLPVAGDTKWVRMVTERVRMAVGSEVAKSGWRLWRAKAFRQAREA